MHRSSALPASQVPVAAGDCGQNSSPTRSGVSECRSPRLRHKLERAEQNIEAQKKLCELLGLPMGEEPSR